MVGATGASSPVSDVEMFKVEVRASLDVVSDAVVSHHSAAKIHGLPEVGFPNRRALVSFTRPGDHHSRGEGFAISGSDLLPHEIAEVDGIPVTSIARTAVDLARLCGMPNALAITDAAAREIIRRGLGDGQTEANALRDAVHDPERVADVMHAFQNSLRQMRGWKGVGWARLGLAHLNPAAESVLESISRWVMVEAKLPLPKVGWPIRDIDGVTRWADFLWQKQRIIGEADGAVKYQETGEILREKRREEALRMMGYRFVRWGWHEAVERPHILLRRIDAVLRQAA